MGVSSMGECKRYKVLAVGKDKEDNLEIQSNYNEEGECTGVPGSCGCTHAEIRLLGTMPNPQIMVVSHSPCINCAKALVEAGVECVYYVKKYRLTEGIEYLVQHGVDVAQIGAGTLIREEI